MYQLLNWHGKEGIYYKDGDGYTLVRYLNNSEKDALFSAITKLWDSHHYQNTPEYKAEHQKLVESYVLPELRLIQADIPNCWYLWRKGEGTLATLFYGTYGQVTTPEYRVASGYDHRMYGYKSLAEAVQAYANYCKDELDYPVVVVDPHNLLEQTEEATLTH